MPPNIESLMVTPTPLPQSQSCPAVLSDYLQNLTPNYLKTRTTDGQADEPMDQSFTLTWSLTITFYEAVVATKGGEKTGGGTPCYGSEQGSSMP